MKQPKQPLSSISLIGCTACKYCADCPSGIKISDIFGIYNNYCKDGDDERAKSLYGALEKNAHDCIGCGQCESLCPQHLPIISLLPKVDDAIQGKA